jgi:two-component system response regulator YesN
MMLRIVIVDDEFYFRSALKANIPWNENGITVVGDANDGESGLELILTERPDVAIVDINMPMIDGLELIQRAQEAGSACRYVILTGYDEFKYAQRAVSLGVSNYILKPVDFQELLQILLREKERLQKERLNQSAVDDLKRQAHKLQLDKSFVDLVNLQLPRPDAEPLKQLLSQYSSYCVALFAVREPIEAKEADLLREATMEINLPMRYKVFVDAKNRLAVVADSRTGDEMNALAAEMSRRIEAKAGRPEVGIGRVYKDFEQICLSYNEALIALKNHFIYSELSGSASAKSVATMNQEAKNRLKSAVLTGKVDEVEEIIKEIYLVLFERHVDFDILVLSALELLSLMVGILSQKNLDAGVILSGDVSLLDQMETFQSVQDFCEWTCNLYREGMSRLEAQKRNLGDVSQRIIEYINAHLTDSTLSISQIAEKLFLNYSYICVSFKRDTGCTINEFITRERMARARFLFEQGAVNISIVAREVGFEDTNYFSKCFRKSTGITPSEYIQSANQNVS